MALKHIFLFLIFIMVIFLASLTYSDAQKNSDLAQKHLIVLPKEYTINQTDVELRQQTINIPDGSPEYYSLLKTTAGSRMSFCIMIVTSVASFMLCFIMIDRMDRGERPRNLWSRHIMQYRSNSDELLSRLLAYHIEQQVRESQRTPQPRGGGAELRSAQQSQPESTQLESKPEVHTKEPPRNRWDQVEP